MINISNQNKKKGSLFSLIKSLTPSEKRYFRLYCKMHQSSSNHIRLFDAIDKQVDFNDEEIREIFRGDLFVKQLHVTKIYLQNLILKSLRNFNTSISKEVQTRNLLLDVEFLYSKELFNQCYYTLEKAEKLALKYDDFTAVIDICDWQRKLANTRSGSAGLKSVDSVNNQEYAINELQKITNCWKLIASSSIYSDHSDVELVGLSNEEFDESGSLTYKVLLQYYRFSKNMTSRNGSNGELYLDRTIELLDNSPERISNSPNTYITTLGNKVSMLVYRKKWDEALEILKKMRAIADQFKLRKSKFSVRTMCRSYNLELEIYRDKKEFELGIERINEVDSFIQANNIPDDYLILFWNQFAHINFGNGKFHKSLEWVNQILDNKSESWQGIKSHARILHLMIHFELGNMIFIRYAVESHRRYLKINKSLGKFERVCLKYFLKAAKAPKSIQRIELEKLHSLLFDLNDPLASADNLDYLDIKSWLEVKIST